MQLHSGIVLSPSYVRALSSFEDGDLSVARDSLENLSDGRHGSRDPEVFPLWDPSQLLGTSQVLLLKAATFQAGDDGSGSDDATSVTSEGEFGSRYGHPITLFDVSMA